MSCLLSSLVPVGLVLLVCGAQGFFLPNATHLEPLLRKYRQAEPHTRTRRAISMADRQEILALHNKLRGQVFPTASNMEYMVWDETLAASAALWAQACLWQHGPANLLMFIGQNLAVHWGRYRSPGSQVQSWYNEVKDYTYPYPHECNPRCPERCSGAMCTHYTQMVWATTNRIGCAVHTCPRMNVWGQIWENAVYLVCNYSPKGNWIGEAPYKHGQPCSACPPIYGGVCWNNLCYREVNISQKETDAMNEVEMAPTPEENHIWIQPKVVRPPMTRKTPAMNYMTQLIDCDTKMKDKCKGSTCNRYQCPAGCLNSKAKVFGSLFYESSSSICRAAIHHGVIGNLGGLVDITRNGKVPFFVKSQKNGVETLSKFKPSSSFTVSRVKEQSLDCHTSVAQLCPFQKPAAHCPRVHCPSLCRDEPDSLAPVVGTNIYMDISSICRAAVHAGIISNESGGFLDVMPVEKKKSYVGSLRNGVQSDSLNLPADRDAFRIFPIQQ